VSIANRHESEQRGLRSRVGAALLALFFAYAPVYAPPWRSDPGQRPNWVLDVGTMPEPAVPGPD
jgi:hypothetical protein